MDWHLGHLIPFLLKRQVEMPSQRKTSSLKEVQGENAKPPASCCITGNRAYYLLSLRRVVNGKL
jgi:hypothetical protein